MRLKTKVNVKIFNDTTERDCLYGPDDARAEVINDHYTEMQSGEFSIVPSTTLQISLGSVDFANGLYIRALGDFDLVLNGGNDTIECRRADSATSSTPVKIYLDAAISQVDITNISADTDLTGHYVVWGDEE